MQTSFTTPFSSRAHPIHTPLTPRSRLCHNSSHSQMNGARITPPSTSDTHRFTPFSRIPICILNHTPHSNHIPCTHICTLPFTPYSPFYSQVESLHDPGKMLYDKLYASIHTTFTNPSHSNHTPNTLHSHSSYGWARYIILARCSPIRLYSRLYPIRTP